MLSCAEPDSVDCPANRKLCIGVSETWMKISGWNRKCFDVRYHSDALAVTLLLLLLTGTRSNRSVTHRFRLTV